MSYCGDVNIFTFLAQFKLQNVLFFVVCFNVYNHPLRVYLQNRNKKI